MKFNDEFVNKNKKNDPRKNSQKIETTIEAADCLGIGIAEEYQYWSSLAIQRSKNYFIYEKGNPD